MVLFQSYEAEVAALLALPGDPLPRIDIGWNTNLAYIQADAWSNHRCRPRLGACRRERIFWMQRRGAKSRRKNARTATETEIQEFIDRKRPKKRPV